MCKSNYLLCICESPSLWYNRGFFKILGISTLICGLCETINLQWHGKGKFYWTSDLVADKFEILIPAPSKPSLMEQKYMGRYCKT